MAQRNDGKNAFQPEFHWPHAADACKAYLDLDALEPLAVRVLARGLLTQRLVAFVGAGISAAYGRQTWTGLMEGLWEKADQAHAGFNGERGWPQLSKQLWPSGLPDFLSYSDHAIKAQIISDMLELLPKQAEDQPKIDDLKSQTNSLLKDFHGFVEWVCERWANSPSSDQDRKSAEYWEAQQLKELAPPITGLAGVLAVLERHHESVADLRRALVEVLTHQGVGVDSPLRLLIDEWGVRRFITTNYDHEIERGLNAMGFAPLDPALGPGRVGQYASIDFGRESTGRALGFALEGPRRHAGVLHLHGDVDDVRSLIVTESDYQRLYLDDHPRRDLVTNATLANFGANPILFVGSDISEDDVLRPMRQFMSGEGHRSDRMAVALFVSPKKANERAQRQVNLWLRYGVYALDVGHASLAGEELTWPAEPGQADGEPWLVGLLQAQQKFRAAVSANEPHAISAFANSLRQLGIPDAIEGIQLELAQTKQIGFAIQNLGNQIYLISDKKKAQALFDITVSWLSSLFLCAKLIQLRCKARMVIEEDSKLARIFESSRQKKAVLTKWNSVMQDHTLFGGRFAYIAGCNTGSGTASDVFDESLHELCESIKLDKVFSIPNRRRILLACAARGTGKGAQFDRLIEARMKEDGRKIYFPQLNKLLIALGGYGVTDGASLPPSTRVAHINLSFSNELGPIVEQVICIMESMPYNKSSDVEKSPHDQLERLIRALRRLSTQGDGRLLIILGNAGVLFDADGRAKNGQISRVMRALLSPRFFAARLDILMYVGESQMPEHQRLPLGVEPKFPGIEALSGAEINQQHRRLLRLNIDARPRPSMRIHVYPLPRTRVLMLARAYFPELTRRMGSLECEQDEERDRDSADSLSRRLYFATGGSRLAQTLLLAWLEASLDLTESAPFSQAADPRVLVDLACSRLRAAPAASAVEACVEFVLDEWAAWHQRRCILPVPPLQSLPVPPLPSSNNLFELWQRLGGTLTPQAWNLQIEILWHLSAFSHPVEVNVLMACQRVVDAATACKAGDPNQCTLIALELLVHRCLVFRIDKRPIDGLDEHDPDEEPVVGAFHRVRYTLHRHIQRHFLRIMGGRNLEATSWDPYTTTMYASLPDEVPVLPTEAHVTLVQVLQDLTDYPREKVRGHLAAAGPVDPDQARRQQMQRADRIRAAYYLARSSYSLGVVSHLTTEAAHRVGRLGHMEQYRRLVRWITHAARYWEKNPDSTVPKGPHGPAVFHPGELVWLYNECGVISLAQGKLHDAEHALGMAEAAVRRIESDDTGSLHTRIRLHSALVQIERGRPHRARQTLLPISTRRGGHRVPPLLAQFYLGQIDHLGGSYQAAIDNYEDALDGLREVGRSRAAAFVLMNLADVRHSLYKQVAASADAGLSESRVWVEADEAISLAQQGGHEDLRVMATLSRVRLCIDAGRLDGQNLFEHIEFAQRYAVLMDMPRVACDAHELRARLLMRQGEYRLSANDATMSLEIAAKYDLKLKKARGLLTLSEILLNRGELDSARTLAAMGREIAVSADYYSCVRGFKDLELRFFEAARYAG